MAVGRASSHGGAVNLVRSGTKQPQPFSASAEGQARPPSLFPSASPLPVFCLCRSRQNNAPWLSSCDAWTGFGNDSRSIHSPCAVATPARTVRPGYIGVTAAT